MKWFNTFRDNLEEFFCRKALVKKAFKYETFVGDMRNSLSLYYPFSTYAKYSEKLTFLPP